MAMIAYSRHAFLSPPIDGWVLCVSTAFFVKVGRRTGLPLVLFLSNLSRELGTMVQFITHRGVETHLWGLAA